MLEVERLEIPVWPFSIAHGMRVSFRELGIAFRESTGSRTFSHASISTPIDRSPAWSARPHETKEFFREFFITFKESSRWKTTILEWPSQPAVWDIVDISQSMCRLVMSGKVLLLCTVTHPVNLSQADLVNVWILFPKEYVSIFSIIVI